MRKHWRYLTYVLRHRWCVFRACWRLGIPWRGVVHDLSKFLPSEWFPYVDSLYGGPWPEIDPIPAGLNYQGFSVRTNGDVQTDFDRAWLLHQHRNPHHWQFWCLVQDDDEDKVLPMSGVCLKEMVADWIGAGLAQGKPDTVAWYIAHKAKMKLHPQTRALVESLLSPASATGETSGRRKPSARERR